MSPIPFKRQSKVLSARHSSLLSTQLLLSVYGAMVLAFLLTGGVCVALCERIANATLRISSGPDWSASRLNRQ